MRDVGRLELIGGHPVINFVNTLAATQEAPSEHLEAYADLLVWSERVGFVTAGQAALLRSLAADAAPDAAAALARALRLRAQLDQLLRARLNDQPSSRETLDGLREAYLAALRHGHLERSAHGYDWSWPVDDDADVAGLADTLDSVLWPLVPQAVDLLRSDRLERLRLCVDCRWLFLDLSRNRSRRWCSMNGCGARAKMRRYRAQQSDPH